MEIPDATASDTSMDLSSASDDDATTLPWFERAGMLFAAVLGLGLSMWIIERVLR
jgi:hypothetical protein